MDQRRARLFQQVGNGLEAQRIEIGKDRLRQAQGVDGQDQYPLSAVARRYDQGRITRETGQRVGRAPAVGDGGARGDAVGSQMIQQIAYQTLFAVIEMGAAGNVEDQPVGRIAGDDRRIALERP